MNIPWRFILALPLGLLLGIGIFIGLLYSQLGIPTESSHWAFDIVQEKEALAAKISGPKLLIVGGSGTLFGISAQEIEKETGYPTINFGSHAGIGLDYILYAARRTARPGDTVLLVIEYELYTEKFDSEPHDDYILARDPEYFHQMSLLEKIDMATHLPFKRIQKGTRIRSKPEIRRPSAPPYSPYSPFEPGIHCLNGNGDEIFNSEAVRPAPKPAMQLLLDELTAGIPSDRTVGFDALAVFIKWAQANHITVLATFPNVIHQPEYDGANGAQTIDTITHFYTSHGVPIIGTAQEVMLPADQFFDTKYHLTLEAALKRTQRLIPELKPHLHNP